MKIDDDKKKILATVAVVLAAAFAAFAALTPNTGDDAASDAVNSAIEKFGIDDIARGADAE